MPVTRWALCLLAAALLSAPARAADVKARCVANHLDGQRARLKGDLATARRKLRLCMQPACPDLVRRDCVGWLREVEGLVSTLIFAAQDGAGADLTNVRVYVDGRLVQERLGGTPVEVRAGKHTVRFESTGRTPFETKIIVALSEKNRLVRATLKMPEKDESKPDPLFAVPFVIAGFGQTAATTGLVLDLVGSSELGDLRETCAPNCDTNDVDRTRNIIIAGDALIAAGVVSIGVAAVWLIVRATSPASEQSVGRRSASW